MKLTSKSFPPAANIDLHGHRGDGKPYRLKKRGWFAMTSLRDPARGMTHASRGTPSSDGNVRFSYSKPALLGVARIGERGCCRNDATIPWKRRRARSSSTPARGAGTRASFVTLLIVVAPLPRNSEVGRGPRSAPEASV